ncbi:MAG: hypothetical protein ABFS28_16680 [Bacteroidota bacterium]
MTRVKFIVPVVFCCIVSLNAQDTISKDMIYRSTIKLISDPSFKCHGALYEINDSSISISSSRIEDYYSGSLKVREIYFSDIKHIHTKRKGNFLLVALAGGGSGFLLGSAIGYNEGGYYNWWSGQVSAEENALRKGIGFAFLGAGIGCLLYYGFDIHIPINGSMDNFNLYRKKMNKYAIKRY